MREDLIGGLRTYWARRSDGDGGGEGLGEDLIGVLRTYFRAHTCLPLMENLALVLASRTRSM